MRRDRVVEGILSGGPSLADSFPIARIDNGPNAAINLQSNLPFQLATQCSLFQTFRMFWPVSFMFRVQAEATARYPYAIETCCSAMFLVTGIAVHPKDMRDIFLQLSASVGYSSSMHAI